MKSSVMLLNPLSLVGWIYDPDHSLPPGMYVDVPHLDCLLVAALITVEGLDHLILKPKQLDPVHSGVLSGPEPGSSKRRGRLVRLSARRKRFVALTLLN